MQNESILSVKATTLNKKFELRPLGWIQSIFYFGIPALTLLVSFYGFRPWLERQGYSPLVSYLTAICIPLALMFAAALIGYHQVEGHPLNWDAFRSRMRYPGLTGKDLLLGFGVFTLGMIGYGAFSALNLGLIDTGVITLPEGLPAMVNPKIGISFETLNQAAGGEIHGQWSLLLLALVTYLFNIVGEELWWRGYILPRQELAFGRYAWLAHGLMWAVFHVFKWWDVLALIPVCLIAAYSAQKLKNNWPAFIGHALTNFLMFPYLIAAVVGLL
jgi:membrane protease YdiL (CAAX protease family)